jgi:hypothetical protein
MNASSNVTIGDSRITKGIVHKTCSNYKVTPRQLARKFKKSDDIYAISLARETPGNQCRNFKIDYPNAIIEDLFLKKSLLRGAKQRSLKFL